LNELSADRRKTIAHLEEDKDITLMEMSTLTEVGVSEVKTEACERLLSYRVDQKMRTKKVDGILNRLHVATPKPRDDVERPACIPTSVLERKAITAVRKRKLEKDLEEELGDDYSLDLKKNYVTIPEDERYDIIPEFMEGHNIPDYIDEDIFKDLDELERAEGLLEEAGFYEPQDMTVDATLKEIRELAKQIRTKRFMLRDDRRLQSKKNKSTIPRNKQPRVRDRSVGKLKETMENLGVDMSGTEKANFTRNVVDIRRSLVQVGNKNKLKDHESSAIVRSTGQPLKRALPRSEQGVKDKIMKRKLQRLGHQNIANKVKRMCLKGEADRFIGNKMPKHLFSGKRGSGKTDRR